MTDRIKLTEKEIDSIIGLFCYESEHGELEGEDKQRTDGFIKQILDDHEKINRIELRNDIVINARDYHKLKEELETISDKLGNELQVKVLEIEELKQELNTMTRSELEMANRWASIQEKLDKIDQLVESSEYPPSREQFQAILKGKA